MKVMIVTPYYYPKIGGLENYARQLGITLRENENVEIVVVTSNHLSKVMQIDLVDNVNVYRLPYWFRISNTPVNPLWAFMLRKIITIEKPDIIHAHTPVPTLADAAAIAAGKTPLVITYHAATLYKKNLTPFNLVVAAYQAYEQITLSRAVKIFAVSQYVKDNLPHRLLNKIEVIPNSVPTDYIKQTPNEDSKHYIFIGSLDKSHSWKGLKEMIEAFAEYSLVYGTNIFLTVIGDGNARGDYEAMVKKKHLENTITFVGSKTGINRDAYLEQSVALIAYPTTSNDAFPTVFLEAWAKGIPVIAAAIGPIPSLIDDGINGYLADPNNPKALANVIHRVENDTDGRKLVASLAKERVRNYFTWEQQAKATMKIYSEIL